jgi:hypothetical protein
MRTLGQVLKRLTRRSLPESKRRGEVWLPFKPLTNHPLTSHFSREARRRGLRRRLAALGMTCCTGVVSR